MTYNIADITRAVCGFANSSEAWNQFRYEIKNKEAVSLGNGLNAYLQEEHMDTETDSYGYVTDSAIWFIFKVTDTKGTERFFKKNGYQDSYDGATFDGALVEVKQVPTTGYIWKEIR